MTNSRLVRLIFCLLAISAFSFAQQQPIGAAPAIGEAPPPPDHVTQSAKSAEKVDAPLPGFAKREPRYLLRPNDIFDVQFEFSPEFNQTLTVQPDGFVTLKDIGDVHVSGKTVPEVVATFKEAYSKILARPEIQVVLKDFEKPYFIANGQVEKPGKYELRGDTTVVEALAIAGGLNNAAKHSQVLLFRRVSQEWVEAHVVDVKKMLNGQNLNEDVHLMPGDMIYVPKSKWSTIRKFIPYTAFNVSPGAL